MFDLYNMIRNPFSMLRFTDGNQWVMARSVGPSPLGATIRTQLGRQVETRDKAKLSPGLWI